jgi:hypothetical protein
MGRDKKSFIVYQSWREPFELLTESEKSQFISNLFKFNEGEEIILDTPMLKMFWTSIEYNLTENDKRYKTSVENGSKGGAPKGNKNASKQPKQPNSTEEQPNQLSVEQNNLNDNVNVNVNEDDNVDIMITDNMMNRLIDKFINITDRFRFQSFLHEVKDYGGWDKVLETYSKGDVSVKNNFNKQLNQYKNGIFQNKTY